MRKIASYVFALVAIVLTSCAYEDGKLDSTSPEGAYIDALGGSGSSGGGNGTGQAQAGVITAGEWNDLSNWSFWNELIQKDDYKRMPGYWGFFLNNRVSVQVLSENDEKPVIDAEVTLTRNETLIARAKTNNQGVAELFLDLWQSNSEVDYSQLILGVNGTGYRSVVKPYSEGINKLAIAATTASNRLEIAFMVDATGSMGDELEYLKTELLDVINRVKVAQANRAIYTGSVFYRDQGDEYITKISGFTSNIQQTHDFIKQQRAAGGGDFPEAVHTALDKSVNELQWSDNSRARILFLLLDAPPHYEQNVLKSIYNSVTKAQAKGIHIIPITASGIDKETEFLMRFLAIATNGTYVFITNHSGIGNDHLEPSTGEYQVELLNDLMVRLINQYSENKNLPASLEF